MFIVISIIAIVAGIWLYNTIKYAIRKNTAEQRIKKYPHAIKGVFGYNYTVSLDNELDIACLNAPSHPEDFWKEKEAEEILAIDKCNQIKRSWPNGFVSWCCLNDHIKDNPHEVEKASSKIVSLETEYEFYVQVNVWKDQQSQLSSITNSFSKDVVECTFTSVNRFGEKIEETLPVALFYKEERNTTCDCSKTNLSNSFNRGEYIHSMCALSNNIVFVNIDCNDLIATFLQSRGKRVVNIQTLKQSQWEKGQIFVIVADFIDYQQTKFICELLFSVLYRPLIVVYSIIKVMSKTKYNLKKYIHHSPAHNIENSYNLDKLLEVHQCEGCYFFTVKQQRYKTVKKAISLYFEKFDTDTIAMCTSEKYKYSYSSPYYKKSADEIKQMWAAKREDSAIKNKKLREDIANLLSNNHVNIDETANLFIKFNEVWNISPYRTNWVIFDRMAGIVANVDCLAYMNGNFVLFSWIRTDSALDDCMDYRYSINRSFIKKILDKRFIVDDDKRTSCIKSYYNRGLEGKAFEDLYDCKFTKYNIEQETIKYILKQNYGIIVEESYIVIMHPKYSIPIAFRPEPLPNEISKFMLSLRLENECRPSFEVEFKEETKNIVEIEEIETIDSIEIF